MYLCRWPNGDFSVVNAATKGEAIELLDEWGNAEEATVRRMGNCMFDFQLSDSGEIELAALGDATREFIMETCYPELQEALDDAGDDGRKSRERIRKAVERERKRLWDQRPAP